MVRYIGDHRSNDAEVIDILSDMREDLADLRAVLPILLEAERRPHQIPGCELGPRRFEGQRLAVELVQHRLVVETIHLRKPTLQENYDDVFSLRRKVRRFRGPGIACGCGLS